MRAAHAAQVMPSSARSTGAEACSAGDATAVTDSIPPTYTPARYESRYPMGVSVSEGQLAREQVAEHHPVADQAVPGVAECCGAVFLEEEMADPGQAVAVDRRDDEPPRLAG